MLKNGWLFPLVLVIDQVLWCVGRGHANQWWGDSPFFQALVSASATLPSICWKGTQLYQKAGWIVTIYFSMVQMLLLVWEHYNKHLAFLCFDSHSPALISLKILRSIYIYECACKWITLVHDMYTTWSEPLVIYFLFIRKLKPSIHTTRKQW